MYELSIHRGLGFLASQSHGGIFPCFISDSIEMVNVVESPPDVASSIIVLDVLERLCPAHPLAQEVRRFVEAKDRGGLFSYFDTFSVNRGEIHYPADADDSAVGIMVASGGKPESRYNGAANRIIDNTNDDGVIQVWLEPKPGHRQSLDPVVCVNAIRLACLYGMAREVQPTTEYVIAHLESGRYLGGTRYYPTPQVFLYFLSKLEKETAIPAEKRGLLVEAVKESLASSTGPASLAMMVTAGRLAGLEIATFAEELAKMQQWRSVVDLGQ